MEEPASLMTRITATLSRTRKTLSEVLYGLTAYELELGMKREKGNLNNLFTLIVFGDLVGLPVLPPYYSMRVLPYVVPYVNAWRRNLLREKCLTDMLSGDA
jgi:hypothetical protein